jgi:DeoR family fructose operon transcriptional repressor
VSNGAHTALILGQNTNHRVFSTGGLLRKHTSSYVGDTACSCLSQYNVNKMFFSCTSIDLDNGITTANEDEAALRRCVMKRSKCNVLLIDSSKFDHCAFCTICGFEQISYLITDREPTSAWRDLLDAKGVKMIYPKP